MTNQPRPTEFDLPLGSPAGLGDDDQDAWRPIGAAAQGWVARLAAVRAGAPSRDAAAPPVAWAAE